jgi:hypothetical protein
MEGVLLYYNLVADLEPPSPHFSTKIYHLILVKLKISGLRFLNSVLFFSFEPLSGPLPPIRNF